MSLAGFSVKNSVLVNILMITILVIGTISFIKLPRELISSVSLNWAMVIAPYPGASPKEVEQLVTIPIEDDIKDIKGIDFISSKSSEGFAAIDVKFEDMSEDDFRYALQELKTRVSSIDDLPEDVERIEVMEFNTGDVIPIINITVSGRVPERKLRKIAEDLEDHLKEIRNVSKVEKMGMSDREIWVEVDPQRLYNFDLTLPQTIQALAGKNLNVPGGKLRSGRSEFLLRTVGEIDAAQDLKKVILRQTPGGRAVSVDDVAQVREIFRSEMGTISRMDGRQAITLSVTKKSSGNSLIVIKKIKEVVREEGRKLHAEVCLGKNAGQAQHLDSESPEDDSDVTITVSELPETGPESPDHFLRFTATSDSSIHIRESLDALENNALVGLALVLGLLYFFLGWRYAFMAGLGMIISFLGAFIFMSYIGATFNGQSLFGLVLVMGIVVDDAIIILENCFRYLQMGYRPKEAAVLGTDEVFAPVVSATLTTISAFLPLMLLPGVMGSFMKMIPIVVSMALLGSMIEAFIILPTHVAEWSGIGAPKPNGRILDRLNHFYPRILRNFLHFRYLVVGVGLLVCIFSLFLIPSLGVDFFSGKEMPRFSVHVIMPTGTSLEVTDETIKRIEAQALALPKEDVDSVIAVTGIIQTVEDWIIKSYVGQVTVDIKQKEELTHSCDELMNMLRRNTSHISGPKSVQFIKEIEGPPVGKPVEIKVKGDNFDRLKELSGVIQAELRKIPGVYDTGDDFNPGKQEIKIRLDEDKAALFGLTVAQVAMTVQSAYLGGEASIWRDKNEEVKIYVKLAERWRRHPEDLLRLQIGTPTGVQVPLAKIASLEIEQGYSEIKRFKEERSITVHAQVDKSKISPVEVNTEIEAKANDILAPFPGYRIDFEGEFKAFTETFDNLKQLFLVGIFLIYLILSGQFRSFVQPLIILFTIPFSFLGAMVGLLVMGSKFTVVTMYGIVALAGIAVNDAIVLISFINNARARGVGNYASLIEGGMLRLRPIILTSVTTIGGLLPMAMGLGGHSESWTPLATTIIFGIAFATVLTLLIIPAVYTIIVDDIATPLRRMIRFVLNLPTEDVETDAEGLQEPQATN